MKLEVVPISETERLQARIAALEFALSGLLSARCEDVQVQTALEIQSALIAELLDDSTYLQSKEQRHLVRQYFAELAWSAWDRATPPRSLFRRTTP